MLFGKSLFQSVVDRLADEATDDAIGHEDTAAQSRQPDAFRIRGLGSGFVPDTRDTGQETATVSRSAYLDVIEDLREIEEARLAVTPHQPPAEPEPPAWLDRLSAEDIAADLAILPDDDRETLQDKRRRFARDNHPDRVHAQFARAATIRMKTANLLVDEALRRASR
ncbi:hypothetical protein ACSV9I_12255 [Rhizobium sp. G187]|uniref:hypothetical protein n=1 Tax=Rhizobium sp. G187 TaxID=3451352 RepID=UPI003EE5B38F